LDSGLEEEIRDFVDRYIDSVEQLEILILLKESAPQQWSAQEINEKLQSHFSSVQTRLRGLCKLNLINCNAENYSYPGSDKSQEPKIEKLILAYKQKRIRVIEMIFSKPKDKLRDFADAFKIKKDPKDG
jgi:predicted transcriptional regulator